MKPSKELYELVQFIVQNSTFTVEKILEVMPQFIKNNTFVSLRDKKGVVAVCAWNINGEVCEVQELIIRPDKRSTGLIKYITALGWNKFPFLKTVKFERERKYPDREPRAYPIWKFIGEKGKQWEKKTNHNHNR